jgi:hypothetical protein
MAESTVIKLKGLEAAALAVLAESEGVTPETMLQNLLRDAAIEMVTGRPRRKRNLISVSNLPESNTADEVQHATPAN